MDASAPKTRPLKIRKVGNSLGVVLTRDLLDTLGVVEGDCPVSGPDAGRNLGSPPTIPISLRPSKRTAATCAATGMR